MIDISGHLRNYRSDTGFSDDTHALTINCCGYQAFRTNNFTKMRKNGRQDYQLLYVYKGAGHFLINGEMQRVSAGSLVLYRPHEPQFYKYFYEDHPVIYWIHFTGTEVEKLLAEYQIENRTIGVHSRLKNIFEEITLELVLKKKNYQQMVNYCFQKLLATINRLYEENTDLSKQTRLIDRLVIELNQNYQKPWTVTDMAEYCMLSEGYFSHYFRQIMDSAPLQYLTNVRISKAKEILLNSDISIAAISQTVGYDNPLYFSRIFRKNTGMSPKAYRNHFLEAEDLGQPKMLAQIPEGVDTEGETITLP